MVVIYLLGVVCQKIIQLAQSSVLKSVDLTQPCVIMDMMKMDAGLAMNARHIWILVPLTTVDQITWNAQNWIWELEVFMFVVYPKLMVANTLWRNFAPNLVA